jgi:hypothetical protein
MSTVVDIQRRMRNSTFNPLSPRHSVQPSAPGTAATADGFAPDPRYPTPLPAVAERALAPEPPSRKASAADTSLSTYSVASRVTVHFQMGRAPALDVRFSALDLPSPTTITSHVESTLRSRPQSEWITSPSQLRRPPPAAAAVHPYANPALWLGSDPSPVSPPPFSNLLTAPSAQSQPPPPPPPLFRTNTYAGESVAELLAERRRKAYGSMHSFGSTTTAAADLDELARQFPGLPPPPAARRDTRTGPELDPVEERSMEATLPVSRQSSWSGRSRRTTASSRPSSDARSPFADPSGAGSPAWQELYVKPRSMALPSSTMVRTEFALEPPARAMVTPPATPPITQQRRRGPSALHMRSGSAESADSSVDDARARLRLTASSAGGARSPALSHADRVKSVGNAPLRNTPPPTRKSFSRDSIPIEHIEFEVPTPAGSTLSGGSVGAFRGLPRSVGSGEVDEFGFTPPR